MLIHRIFIYIIIVLSFSPFVSLANSNEQQVIIDKIIQDQTQWGKSIAANRSSANSLISPKIVGGSTTPRGRHPEFALLLFTDSVGDIINYCGGTLIASNKILTAAHCTVNYANARIFVIPNFYSFNDGLVSSDIYSVFRKNIHPNYFSSSFDYDVSVLTLTRNANTATSKLFEGESQFINYQATIVGVGTLSEGGVAPANLQAASVPIVSNPICRGSYGAAITDRMLCAGLVGGGRDSCQGDSGGPLWVNFEGQKVQAGITSFGQGCARPNFYGVYSRVSSLNGFIRQYAPNATFIAEAKPYIIPFLQLLLLDEEEAAPVCNHSINLGAKINVEFDPYCFNFTNSRYFKTFTFTLDQTHQVTITSTQSNDFNANVRLFAGTDVSISPLDNDSTYTDEAILLNELTAGTYTIELTSSNVDRIPDLQLQLNQCEFAPITLNATVQSSFSTNCRSIGEHSHLYARHYTFTLNQAQQINIAAKSKTNSFERLRLFAGTDVFATPIIFDSFFSNEAVLVLDLNIGTYTIEATNENLELIDLNLLQNNCQSWPITLDTTALNGFSNDCRSISDRDNSYASYYTFTLDQTQQSTITSPRSNDYYAFVRLFAGTDVSSSALDSQRTYTREAVLLNELAAGMYTIEITSSNVAYLAELSILLNQCEFSPISLNTIVQSSFSRECRSIDNFYSHPYARYYTFTLNQTQQISIVATSQFYHSQKLTLFSGTDVTANTINRDSFFSNEAMLLMELNSGTYTIEITSESLDDLIDLSVM